jgi:4-hydroxybenzoate polyprenyltransferase
VLAYAILSSLLFVFAASRINALCFKLSPLAIAICFFYSFCKRFTSCSHLVLALALSLSPLGAWAAVTGSFSPVSVLMALVVFFWTAGFDILYALMDMDFDRRQGLKSIPARFGLQKSLWISRFFHLLMMLFWAAMIVRGAYGGALWCALALAALLVLLEHLWADPKDLKKMNLVFFKLNILVSFSMLAGSFLEFYR